MNNINILLRILCLPKFYIYLFLVYLLDLFLEHYFGDTYLKRALFLPVILHAQFLGAKFYDDLILQDIRKMKNIKIREYNNINIIKLKYFDKGKKVSNLEI